MIHHGDCLDVMATLPEASVDAVVTDPPYGLEFMGKGWDKLGAGVGSTKADADPFAEQRGRSLPFDGGGQRVRYGASARSMQEWHHRWAVEALRVTKPGGYLLAFGGTRTFHRLAVAIEDAGWIIRDTLVWAYASGFPKGRANLKPAWEPIVMARKPGPLRHLNIDGCRIPTNGESFSVPQSDPTKRAGTVGTDLGISRADVEDFQAAQRASIKRTEQLGRWPANVLLADPIFDGGVEGVVGGGTADGAGPQERTLTDNASRDSEFHMGESTRQIGGDSGTYSRFFLIPKADRADREPVLGGHGIEPRDLPNYQPTVLVCECGERWKPPENGGLLRCNHPREMYHYEATPRAPSKRTNLHPTVKPKDLMRHLVRLVTPAGGTVLDPFLGSGTTAIACELEGFPWIGIEKEAEYVAITEARLNGTQRGLGLSA